jgi:hypothetical protein
MKKAMFLSVVGMVALAGCVEETTARGAMCSAINYGNDSSTWAFDNECDDPRFYGPGTATILLDSDMFRDATDCRNLCYAGLINPR